MTQLATKLDSRSDDFAANRDAAQSLVDDLRQQGRIVDVLDGEIEIGGSRCILAVGSGQPKRDHSHIGIDGSSRKLTGLVVESQPSG